MLGDVRAQRTLCCCSVCFRRTVFYSTEPSIFRKWACWCLKLFSRYILGDTTPFARCTAVASDGDAAREAVFCDDTEPVMDTTELIELTERSLFIVALVWFAWRESVVEIQ